MAAIVIIILLGKQQKNNNNINVIWETKYVSVNSPIRGGGGGGVHQQAYSVEKA